MPDTLAELLRLNPEERERVDRVVGILSRGRQRQQEHIGKQLAPADRRRVQTERTKAVPRYTLSHTARVPGVSRQAVYYWIRTGRIRPKRDGRGYLVFTGLDIVRLMRWRNALLNPPPVRDSVPDVTSCCRHDEPVSSCSFIGFNGV